MMSGFRVCVCVCGGGGVDFPTAPEINWEQALQYLIYYK